MSIGMAVKEAGKKLNNHMREMTIEPSFNHDGEHDGFNVTHHYHNYDHPKNNMSFHVKPHQLRSHIEEHFKKAGNIKESKEEY